MSSLSTLRFREELHIHPSFVMLALTLLASGMLVASYGVEQADPLSVAGIALAVLTAIGWRLTRIDRKLGAWALVLTLLLVSDYVVLYSAYSDLAALRILATGMTAVLLGVPAGLAVALAETGLTISWCAWSGAALSTHLGSLGAIWVVWGLLFAAYRPSYLQAIWSADQVAAATELIGSSRRQRQQLKDAMEDLAEANHQAALMNERLASARLVAEEAQRTKADFVAKVSHEFRTPLNLIIGLIDLIVETPGVYGPPLPPALLEDMEIVHRSCEHLAAMINDVLDLSQIEAGQMAVHREPVELREVVAQAAQVVTPLVQMKGLDLDIDIADDLPVIHCDRTRIRQVILNLVSNAARFTDKGSISIVARRRGAMAEVSVSDTGTGVAEEDAERIFEPFYQARNLQRGQHEGAGLGLSISQQFVALHGGRMWLESVVGEGSTFYFELPIRSTVVANEGASRWLSDEWRWRRHAGRIAHSDARLDERYVICERGYDLISTAQRYAPHWEFVPADGVEQARERLAAAPAQAVLCNARDAATLLDEVRKGSGALHDTPLMGCSLDMGADRERWAAIDAYLVKPFKRVDLQEAIVTAVGHAPERLLLVDDDSDTLRLGRRLLGTSFPEAIIEVATDGRSALEQLQTTKPDVLLLDVILPDMEGWDVLRAMQDDPDLENVPTVMVSAQDPLVGPPSSPYLLATSPQGISINRLLRCCQAVSRILLQPERSLRSETASRPAPR